MGMYYAYNNLIKDIEARESAIEEIDKFKSSCYEDSELCEVDSLVIQKSQAFVNLSGHASDLD